MPPIEITICLSRDQSSSDLSAVLEPFNATHPTSSGTRVTVIPWDAHKDDLTAIAIYGKGPDISQVGATLVNDLVVMNALRPFTSREITSFGGPSTFNATAWQSSRRIHDGQTWAVPWLADPRAILYWKDLINRAGVQEQNAFQSFDHMEHTFQRLQASGVETPWVLPIGDRLLSLQAACSWIWGAGGDFVSADNRTPFFHHPDAISGLKVYFGLFRYMPKEGQPLDGAHAFQLFFDRKAAVTTGNLGHTLGLLNKLPPELRSQIGVALPPGAPLIGSSSLVVWKHAHHEQDAVELIRFLLTKDAQVKYCQRIGYLPVRNDALMEPPYATDPIFRGFTQALQKGRLFPLVKLGGLLEDKLATIFNNIWVDLVAGEKIDLDTTLAKEFMPIIRHYEQWAG